MRKKIFFLLTSLFLFFSVNLPVMAELKIIRLNYSSPDAIIATLNQLFGNRIKAASAPSINAVIINYDEPQVIEEIEKLAAVLDHKPAVLRFSIRRDAESSQTTNQVLVGRNDRFARRTLKSHETGEKSVVAVEFRKARLTDDKIRIFAIPTYLEESAQTLTISHGLMVSGRLIGKDFVQADIWYSNGEGFEAENLLTSLEIPIGQWFDIGGNQQKRSQSSPSLSLGNENQFGKKNSGSFIDRHYLIKIDVIRY